MPKELQDKKKEKCLRLSHDKAAAVAAEEAELKKEETTAAKNQQQRNSQKIEPNQRRNNYGRY